LIPPPLCPLNTGLTEILFINRTSLYFHIQIPDRKTNSILRPVIISEHILYVDIWEEYKLSFLCCLHSLSDVFWS